MTGADEDSDESTSGTDGGTRSERSAEDASGSRFGEFFDRLEERDAERTRSEAESAPDTAEGTSGGGSSASGDSPEGSADAETEAEPEGWMWGSPKGGPEDAPDRTDAPDSDSPSDGEDGPEAEQAPADGSGSDTDRLWNTDIEPISDSEDGNDNEDGDESEGEIPDEPSARRSDTDDLAEGSPSSIEPGSEREREELNVLEGTDDGDDAEPTAQDRDRWSELGASLGIDDVEPRENRRSDTDAPGGSSGATDSSRDRRQNEDGDPWDDRDTTVDVPGDDRTSPGGTGPPAAVGLRETELDRVTSVPSVLVLGPTAGSVSDAICSRFLTGEEGSRDVLFVTFEQSPDERIDVCHRADEWAGGEIGIIEVGRGRRNAAASEITGGDTVGSITVRHVSKPGDLSKLGIVITQLLSKFDETPRQTVLCFHTLSALHSQVGTKTLFRFLNTLQGRLRSSDALGHYHMDPDLHDEIVIETLRPIFDSVVRYSADGELEIE